MNTGKNKDATAGRDVVLERRYSCFISYRHADNKEAGRQWANWLHQSLEGYEVPRELAGAKNLRGLDIRGSLYPVFRDEEELPAEADLTTNIRSALERSDLLVVLCSPRAVRSKFVADEIRIYKELGHADRILCMIIDGEPNVSRDAAKGGAEECLPEPLRYGVPDGRGMTRREGGLRRRAMTLCRCGMWGRSCLRAGGWTTPEWMWWRGCLRSRTS